MSDTPAETERACTCTPLPNAEGPCAWCDVHGQPSVAWTQASISIWRQANELWHADRDRLSVALRAMAARLTRERRQSRAWEASYDWHAARLAEELAAAKEAAYAYNATCSALVRERDVARTALARAGATADAAVEALEAQGAVVEALNAENARLSADPTLGLLRELVALEDRFGDGLFGELADRARALLGEADHG